MKDHIYLKMVRLGKVHRNPTQTLSTTALVSWKLERWYMQTAYACPLSSSNSTDLDMVKKSDLQPLTKYPRLVYVLA